MPRLLTIDDDRSTLHLASRALDELELEFDSASTAAEALEMVRDCMPDVVLLDVALPDGSGLDFFRELKKIDPQVPAIFVTADDTSDMAIEAMKLGAFEYIHKPVDIAQLESTVEEALQSRRMMTAPAAMDNLLAPSEQENSFVGTCEAMQEVFKAIGRVAGQNVTVLIRGESGTGKELAARAIYQHSDRYNQNFLAVNCAALSETLLESELFGHEKGSFTGAHSQHIGKFEQCNGGTIFLDEVGDMSPSVQAKVLRLLQEQKFERVGGNETIQTDVRIISATNRDLESMCREREYRKDLYYRLNGYTIELPALRDRENDRIMLIEHFLALIEKELGQEVTGVSPQALEILLEYDWPGNVRELQSVLRRSMLMSAGSVLIESSLPSELLGSQRDSELSLHEGDQGETEAGLGFANFIERRIRDNSGDLYAETLSKMESQLLTILLREVGGNQSEAARILGITRGSLRNKIRTLKISIEQVISVADASA